MKSNHNQTKTNNILENKNKEKEKEENKKRINFISITTKIKKALAVITNTQFFLILKDHH